MYDVMYEKTINTHTHTHTQTAHHREFDVKTKQSAAKHARKIVDLEGACAAQAQLIRCLKSEQKSLQEKCLQLQTLTESQRNKIQSLKVIHSSPIEVYIHVY